MKLLLLSLLVLTLFSCASSNEAPQSAARGAAYAGEHHFVNPGRPDREVFDVEFYYKHCALESTGSRGGYGRMFECAGP